MKKNHDFQFSVYFLRYLLSLVSVKSEFTKSDFYQSTDKNQKPQILERTIFYVLWH